WKRKLLQEGWTPWKTVQSTVSTTPTAIVSAKIVVLVALRACSLATQRRVRLVAHQTCPEHSVELGSGHLIGFGKVEAGCDLGPIRRVVLGFDFGPCRELHGGISLRQRQGGRRQDG